MEKDDRFELVWESLVDRGIIEEWERGATTAEDVVDDANQQIHLFRAWEGNASSTRQKPERRAMVEVPVEPTEREKDMTAAFREYLAVHAAQRPIVRKFRTEYLPDGRLYTDDHHISLLLEEQHVAKAGTTNLQQYLDENRGKPDDWAVRFEFSTKPAPGDDSGLMTWEELAEQFAEEEIDQVRQMEEDWWGKAERLRSRGTTSLTTTLPRRTQLRRGSGQKDMRGTSGRSLKYLASGWQLSTPGRT